MKKIILITFLFLTTVYAAEVPTNKEKPRVAIMDLNPAGISSSTAVALSDILRTEIFNTGSFIVLERAQINEVLKEQEFQLSGCTETECAIQIGQLLSAHKVLVGTVSRIGNSFVINARIVDISKGALEFADKYVASSEEELIYGCEWFAKKLAAKMQGKKFEEPVPSYKVKKGEQTQTPTTQKEPTKLHGTLHIWGGYGNNGSIDLKFFNTFATKTKDELGLWGNFPDYFNSFEWSDIKSTKFTPFGISLFWDAGPSCTFAKPGNEIFYTKFKIAKQTTKAVYNEADEIPFEFTTEDYFNVGTFYDGIDILLGSEIANFITPYFILSGGLTFNSYEGKTIKGYTQGSDFTSPSEDSVLGFGYFISFGFQLNFTKVFGIFFEGRYFGNWFAFTRNIEYEDDSYTITAPMFIGGLSFSF